MGQITLPRSSVLSAANFAAPSASVGLIGVNGVAVTAMRSDSAPALDQNIAPTWTNNHRFDSGVSITGPPVANSKLTIIADNAAAYVGSAAGPLVNVTADRANVQGFWIQNKSIAANATNYGLEIANDTIGRELYAFNTSTTYTAGWGAGIPIGPVMGLDTPATVGYLTIAAFSNNQFGVNLATKAIAIGNATDNGAVSFAGTGKVTFGGVARLPVFTVATLPAGAVGDKALVSNALAPAFGAAVAGGGAVTITVFFNGAAWIVG